MSKITDMRPVLSDQEFGLFRDLVYQVAGMQFGASRKPFLVGRLTLRLRALGLASFTDYYDFLVQGTEPLERDRFFDCICTGETSFFREPKQFELLEGEILPTWRHEAENGLRPPSIRAWSAGCSTGQEAYSLGMLLLEHCHPDAGWDLQILASDLSTRALGKARQGSFPMEEAAGIPESLLKRYMLKGVGGQGDRMRVIPDLRELMEFRRMNLNSDSDTVTSAFDLIFCRNVLDCFDKASRSRALSRLVRALKPGGYLFLGDGETLSGMKGQVHRVMPTVFRSTAVNPNGTPVIH